MKKILIYAPNALTSGVTNIVYNLHTSFLLIVGIYFHRYTAKILFSGTFWYTELNQ